MYMYMCHDVCNRICKMYAFFRTDKTNFPFLKKEKVLFLIRGTLKAPARPRIRGRLCKLSGVFFSLTHAVSSTWQKKASPEEDPS